MSNFRIVHDSEQALENVLAGIFLTLGSGLALPDLVNRSVREEGGGHKRLIFAWRHLGMIS